MYFKKSSLKGGIDSFLFATFFAEKNVFEKI